MSKHRAAGMISGLVGLTTAIILIPIAPATAESGVTDFTCMHGQQTVKAETIVDPLTGGAVPVSCPAGTTSTTVTNEGDQPMQAKSGSMSFPINVGQRVSFYVDIDELDYQSGL